MGKASPLPMPDLREDLLYAETSLKPYLLASRTTEVVTECP
jgi:hypothetical protein